MESNPNLSGPQFFDNAERVSAYRKAPLIPGREAPAFFAGPEERHRQNPFSAHIPEPTLHEWTETDRHGERTVRKHEPHHGIPGYEPTTIHERPVRQNVPLDRLESTQQTVDHDQVNRYKRRKSEAPPIEVTHWVNEDRYVIGEGNHRATVALLQGRESIPAYVTRARTWKRD